MSERKGLIFATGVTLLLASVAAIGLPRPVWSLGVGLALALLVYAALTPSERPEPTTVAPTADAASTALQQGGSGNTQIIGNRIDNLHIGSAPADSDKDPGEA